MGIEMIQNHRNKHKQLLSRWSQLHVCTRKERSFVIIQDEEKEYVKYEMLQFLRSSEAIWKRSHPNTRWNATKLLQNNACHTYSGRVTWKILISWY